MLETKNVGDQKGWRLKCWKPYDVEDDTKLKTIRIILVEPAGPLNVGSVARVMKNFGLSQLVLVNPQCDRQSPDALQMAVHARDLLDSAQVVASLEEALIGVHRAIATTGIAHSDPRPLEVPRQALPWLLPPLDQPTLTSALIFGREDHGLTSDELHLAQRLLQIPSHPTYPSLNLAQAVAICCYELTQLAQTPPARPVPPPSLNASPSSNVPPPSSNVPPPTSLLRLPTSDLPAPLHDLQGFYHHLESTLLKIGYLYPHTANSRMKHFRRLYNRAQLTSHDIKMLRGILSQVDWATAQTQLVQTQLAQAQPTQPPLNSIPPAPTPSQGVTTPMDPTLQPPFSDPC